MCVCVCVIFVFFTFLVIFWNHHLVNASFILLYNITSHDGNKEKEVGLTFKCHIRNIMPHNIFYDGMGGAGNNLFCFFIFIFFIVRGGDYSFSQFRSNGRSFATITKAGIGRILCYNKSI